MKYLKFREIFFLHFSPFFFFFVWISAKYIRKAYHFTHPMNILRVMSCSAINKLLRRPINRFAINKFLRRAIGRHNISIDAIFDNWRIGAWWACTWIIHCGPCHHYVVHICWKIPKFNRKNYVFLHSTEEVKKSIPPKAMWICCGWKSTYSADRAFIALIRHSKGNKHCHSTSIVPSRCSPSNEHNLFNLLPRTLLTQLSCYRPWCSVKRYAVNDIHLWKYKSLWFINVATRQCNFSIVFFLSIPQCLSALLTQKSKKSRNVWCECDKGLFTLEQWLAFCLFSELNLFEMNWPHLIYTLSWIIR